MLKDDQKPIFYVQYPFRILTLMVLPNFLSFVVLSTMSFHCPSHFLFFHPFTQAC